MSERYIWLSELKRPAILVQQHAYYSVVEYIEDGIRIEVEVANDEYEELNGDDD